MVLLINMKNHFAHEYLVSAELECIQSLEEELCVIEYFVDLYVSSETITSDHIEQLLLRTDINLSVAQAKVLIAYKYVLRDNEIFIPCLLVALLISLFLAYSTTKIVLK